MFCENNLSAIVNAPQVCESLIFFAVTHENLNSNAKNNHSKCTRFK